MTTIIENLERKINGYFLAEKIKSGLERGYRCPPRQFLGETMATWADVDGWHDVFFRDSESVMRTFASLPKVRQVEFKFGVNPEDNKKYQIKETYLAKSWRRIGVV